VLSDDSEAAHTSGRFDDDAFGQFSFSSWRFWRSGELIGICGKVFGCHIPIIRAWFCSEVLWLAFAFGPDYISKNLSARICPGKANLAF